MPQGNLSSQGKVGPFKNFSANVTNATGGQQIYTAAQAGGIEYLIIYNASATANIWYSRQLTNATTTVLAPNAPGTYKLAPGQYQEFALSARSVPTNALWAIADATGGVLSVEAI